MLKAAFIGSQNEFNEVIVHWLSRQVNLVGVVWTKSTAWQKSWKGRLDFARQRSRRYGIWKTIDETLFYLYYHARFERRSAAELHKKVIEPYWNEHGYAPWCGDSIFTHNVNTVEVRQFLGERRPDIGLAMCINNYFGKRLRGIFPHGILLWHEGITPEYKGLYSPFWAVYNVDLDRIGYTLLRVSDELDAGEPFAQGPAVDIDPLRHSHQYIGHKAIADSREAVARVLRDFHEGVARPLQRKGAPAGYYTYPGLSDLIRQRIRLWRWQRQSRSAAVPQPNGAGSLFRPTSYQFENTFSEKDSRPLDV